MPFFVVIAIKFASARANNPCNYTKNTFCKSPRHILTRAWGLLIRMVYYGKEYDHMAGRKVHMTRAGRRVFAQKSRPSLFSLRTMYIPRGGGYL